MALTSPITGQELREQTLEQGADAVAAIYLQAIEEGHGDEKLLAEKLGMVMQEASRPKRVKTQNKRKWFVEYCCSENSACCRVADACSIPYLGLSRDFGDRPTSV